MLSESLGQGVRCFSDRAIWIGAARVRARNPRLPTKARRTYGGGYAEERDGYRNQEDKRYGPCPDMERPHRTRVHVDARQVGLSGNVPPHRAQRLVAVTFRISRNLRGRSAY